MSKSFYITTTLPYVNAEPHIGFAMELIRADIIARAKILQGYDVFFNTGTDEHGQKLFSDAKIAGEDVKTYVDRYANQFKGLKNLLQIHDSVHFIRTTDPNHELAAQEFWKICDKNGFIYKKTYKIKYCVGCELEKTDGELVDGKCPIHPNREIELIDEENYFFKFSSFQKQLLSFYEKNPDFIIPDFRFNEMRAFVERGLEDFSISRLKSKMPWGVGVPGDDTQVMYVWFDALVNYISTLGWPFYAKATKDKPFDSFDNAQNKSAQGKPEENNFEKYWINGTPTQYCGKDNLRQQGSMWQAMLMAVGIPNSHQIVINGFFTGEGGLKMSKSLGNGVDPYEVVENFGVEALRYYVSGGVSIFEDSPVSFDLIKSSYNSKLANGLGNLTSRIMKMATSNLDKTPEIPEKSIPDEYFELLNKFEIGKAVNFIWDEITALDLLIQTKEPFKLVKTNKEEGVKVIEELVVRLYTIARMLNPILPDTSDKIKNIIRENKMPSEPLFLRKD